MFLFRCPKPVNRKDNETECNEGTKVCQAGECKGSICLKFGMDQVPQSHVLYEEKNLIFLRK